MNFWKSLLDVKTDDLSSIITQVEGVVSAALGIITVGVTIIAVYIAYKFFTADDESKRKNAKAQLVYCVIGIVVLVALLILAPTLKDLIGKMGTDSGGSERP